MRGRTRILNIAFGLLIAIAYQSCDSTLNIDKPETFYKYIGDDNNQTAVDLVSDEEGNIYVLGTSQSASDGVQIYIVKTDGEGILQWEKTYGDAGDETPKDIELLSNGTLAVVADRIDISNNERDFAIFMINRDDGTLTQPAVIDGTPGLHDFVNTITATLDGGFLVASYTDNGVYKDGYVRRYDESLQATDNDFWKPKIEQITETGGYDMIPVKVIQYQDMFYTFGYTNSVLTGDNISDYNFFGIVSNDLNDATRVFINPGPDPNSNERLTAVRAAPPQSGAGFILTGYTSAGGSNRQALYMVHIMEDITALVPSIPSSYIQGTPKVVTSELSAVSDTPASMYPSRSSGFLILAEENTVGDGNIYLKKVDNDFNDAWSDPHTFHVFGGVGDDRAGAVTETADGKILVCGTMILGEVNGQSKILLMKLSPEGMFNE